MELTKEEVYEETRGGHLEKEMDVDGIFQDYHRFEDVVFELESRIRWMVDNRQIWIIPILNPDGFEYAHEQYASGHSDMNTLWRKNREPNINPATGTPYPEVVAGKEMWGVDLNRNYGYHWGEIGYQGYADPSREDHIGPLDRTDEDNDRRLNEDKMDNIDNE